MLALLAGVSPHLAAVEARMGRVLASRQPRVQTLIDGLLPFHGKMLRPALLLLTAEACGGVRDPHIGYGAALELIHTATLIHDDLIDDADLRRGKTTAHVRHGNTSAVLLGDYLYTHAFDLAAGIGDLRALQRLTATTNTICAGELHQQLAARDLDCTEAEYDAIIYAKTAALCELAAELGAIGAAPEWGVAAAAYGRACGMAFQIVDDCLDFSGDAQRVGKTLATDVERGRMTLPVLRALAGRFADYAAMETAYDATRPADAQEFAALIQDANRVAVARGAFHPAHCPGKHPGVALPQRFLAARLQDQGGEITGGAQLASLPPQSHPSLHRFPRARALRSLSRAGAPVPAAPQVRLPAGRRSPDAALPGSCDRLSHHRRRLPAQSPYWCKEY